MPTININKKSFEKFVGKKLSTEKLKDRISYLGTDLESVEKNEIVVEIFPNRPDMLSTSGFARAFSSFIGVKKGLKEYKATKSNYKVIVDKSVKDVRPFTACAVVKNLKLNDDKIKEIIQIQEKLHITFGRHRRKVAIGIYPMEKIKWPIKYLAKNPGEIRFQPLESNKFMNGNEILKNHSAGREYRHLLDGLNKYPIFIDSNNQILSMPPIINSHKIGKVSEKTKDVFIECSGFDFETLKESLNIIVTALNDMGGNIYSVELEGNKKAVTPDLNCEEMKVDADYVNKILGLNLKESQIKELLEKMGFGYKNKKALIPCYRTDVLHPIDLVEDIAIAYGYENFKEEIPNISGIGEENFFEVFKNKIGNLLVGFDLIEVMNYHITNKRDLIENMDVNLDFVELESGNKEYNILRNWLTPGLLKVLSENKHNEFPQNIFEIGKVFVKDKNKVKEVDRLCVALCHNKTNFTEIKQILDSLFSNLDLKSDIENINHNSFIEGRVGRISIKDKKIAYVGEIHPKCLEKFGIDMPVSVLELNLSELFKFI
tara:strand:- start:4108 stop:5739 length:1632 start_codon:yes stop_codon:yes gene_type:complete